MSTAPSERAARELSRVALVTCAELPDLYPDDRLLRAALQRLGVAADPVVWDDPDVDWDGYGLSLLRSPWDYVGRRAEFVAWAANTPRLANPADVVAWNTDKTYLRELAAAGLPVAATEFVAPSATWRVPTAGEHVVKPTVSAGARDSGRYDLARPEQRELAAAHVARLGAAGRPAMVQPYLSAVDEVGETGVLFLPDAAGRLAVSHGIRKAALLRGPDTGASILFRAEEIVARTPSPAEVAVAERVLAAVPGGADRLSYARVDLIPGPDGAPQLLELELTEPTLFFEHGAGSADRLAAAIATRLPGR